MRAIVRCACVAYASAWRGNRRMQWVVWYRVTLAYLAGVAAQTMAQMPASVVQNPLAGSRVFGAKGCVQCHAVNGVDGTRGPDLGRNTVSRSFFDFAVAMWNHRRRCGWYSRCWRRWPVCVVSPFSRPACCQRTSQPVVHPDRHGNGSLYTPLDLSWLHDEPNTITGGLGLSQLGRPASRPNNTDGPIKSLPG